eukprot:scaffold141452_cov232-Phaeocystis_antarctica.AAC.1
MARRARTDSTASSGEILCGFSSTDFSPYNNQQHVHSTRTLLALYSHSMDSTRWVGSRGDR